MGENKKIKTKKGGRWDHGIMKGWVRKGKSKREKRKIENVHVGYFLENISQPSLKHFLSLVTFESATKLFF